MQINIDDLSKELLNKIPLSIRLNLKDNILDTDALPFEIAYEFRNFENESSIVPYTDKKTIDLTPKFSVYSDYENIVDRSKAAIEYLKNYLLISKGEYPFDPIFGTDIRKYINIKDSSTRDTLLQEEFRNIKTTIEYAFNTPVEILNFNVERVDLNLSIGYVLNMKVRVDKVVSKITVIDTKDEFVLMPNINTY